MKMKRLPSAGHSYGEYSWLIMLDVIICLAFINLIMVFYYGLHALLITVVSVLSCIIFESAACFVMKGKNTIPDLSAVVTGMILAAICPASAPLWLPAVGGAFAIIICKIPFGGRGNNIFNPAAAAWLFMSLSFPTVMSVYPDPVVFSYDGGAALASASPLSDVALGITPNISSFELAFGRFPGPMGATPIVVLAACAIYLIIRRTAPFSTMLSMLVACGAIAVIFPRLGSRLDSAVFELSLGCIVFAAIFMATDPVTSPKTTAGRILFGIGCGVITMLFRYFGSTLYEGAPAAILIMNCLSKALDEFVSDFNIGWVKGILKRKAGAAENAES